MRTIEDGFLAAIIEQPDEDSPRLIFSDWLEEHQQEERAEFIRVQVELAACEGNTPPLHVGTEPVEGMVFAPKAKTNPQWEANERRKRELRRRERELRSDSSHALDWLQGSRFEWDYFSPVLRRGFIEEITLSLPDWLVEGKKLERLTPLRVVRLTCEPATLENSVNLSYAAAMDRWLVQLAQDDEPGDNPIGRLHTLDLSRLVMDHFQLSRAMKQAYRPWRGLRVLILPNWDYAGRQGHYAGEQWKQRVPTLERVEFAPSSTTQEVENVTALDDFPVYRTARRTGTEHRPGL